MRGSMGLRNTNGAKAAPNGEKTFALEVRT